MMQATNLKTNHLSAPLGMDAGTLFLSWQCAGGVRQTAYEIEVTAGAGNAVDERKGFWAVGCTPKRPPLYRPRRRDSGASACGMKTISPAHGAKLSLKRVLRSRIGRGVWVCPETEEPDIDCIDAINAFCKAQLGSRSRRRWKPPARAGAALSAPPPGKLSAQNVHRPGGEGKRLYITAKGAVCGMAERQAGRRHGACPRQLYCG